jgi:16S rRNA (guanine966-N2)-methyltransferase
MGRLLQGLYRQVVQVSGVLCQSAKIPQFFQRGKPNAGQLAGLGPNGLSIERPRREGALTRHAMRVIAGAAHGRRLKAPRGLVTRPTTARARGSIFSRLQTRIDFDGIRVLDIFAGSGSLGIEALSRGAGQATFIDSSREAARVIADNLERLGIARRGRVILSDVRRALGELARAGELFDLIFVDAPYKDDLSAEVLASIARDGLAAPGGWIVIRQFKRAPGPPLAPDGFERTTVATIGDHRIAFYRRPSAAPSQS